MAVPIISDAIQYFGARDAAKKSAEFAGKLQGRYEGEAKRLKQQTDQYGLGSNMRKYAQFGMMDQAEAQRDIARQLGAESMGALKKGGIKALLGGLGAVQQQGFQQMTGIEAAETQRQQDVMRDVAGQEQAIAREKYGAAREDLSRARDIALESEMGKFSAEQAKRQAGFQLAEGLASSGMELATGGFPIPGQGQTAKKGAKLKETPGAFSHRKNPIDIMRRGAKIGEMTGGETIMNPEQTKKVEKLAANGDTELHRYLQKLFKRFNRDHIG